MTAAEIQRLLQVAGHNLYLTTLTAPPTSRAGRVSQAIRSPEPGDVVYEASTVYQTLPDTVVRVGVLDRMVFEPSYTPEEWQEAGGETSPIPRERVWYICPLQGGEPVRWTNADFLAIPREVVQ